MTDKLNPNQQPELSEQDAELLSAYIDEMLPVNEQHELETRLRNDPFLRRELGAMRQTVAWINSLPTLKAPRDFTISAEDVAPTANKVIPMPKQNWWFAASAAAILIVVIGVVAILSNVSNQAPAIDAAFEQVAVQSTNPAQARTDEVMAYDAADEADGVASDSDFADESATGGMSAEAPPAPEISRSADTEIQSQSPVDINSRSMTVQPTLVLLGQGSGADAESIAPTTTANTAQSQPQEAVMMTNATNDNEESADTAPNANIASVMEDSANNNDAVEEAEADDMQDADSIDIFAMSPEEQTIEVIRSILEAFRRFLEALQA